jgi:glucosamine--fructose-6-phosphate aminotransferase (isomerizing)
MLSLHLGRLRGVLQPAELRAALDDLAQLPALVGQTLAGARDETERLARLFFQREDFLYLGRGINYPIALEGALKLKEISYIHAEGYPAGEMKHGPIALIDDSMPVVAIAIRDHVYDKMISQIEQVKARRRGHRPGDSRRRRHRRESRPCAVSAGRGAAAVAYPDHFAIATFRLSYGIAARRRR